MPANDTKNVRLDFEGQGGVDLSAGAGNVVTEYATPMGPGLPPCPHYGRVDLLDSGTRCHAYTDFAVAATSSGPGSSRSETVRLLAITPTTVYASCS